MPVQRSGQILIPDVANNAGPAEVPLLLVGLPRGKVAGAGAAVLRLPGGREAETLLRPLVRLHLGHDRISLGKTGFASCRRLWPNQVRPIILKSPALA